MKKTFLTIFALSLCVFGIGAQTPKTSTAAFKPISCDLSKLNKTETIPLSTLVGSCTFVQFEDIDKALFKPWFTTVTNKYIGVSQQDGGVFKLFDHSGKFLCDVGAVGQGPGEYTSLYDQLIDEKKGLIYLAPFSGKKIQVYNLSGKFVKDFVAPQDLHKPRLYLSADGILSVVHMPFSGDKAMAIQFDSNGKVVKVLAPPAQFVVHNFDGELFCSKSTSAFDFQHTSCDTLFHYNSKDNKIYPAYSLSTGSDKSFRQYVELNTKLLTNIFGKALICTDKKTNTSSKVKIVNDFYGNLDVPVNIVTFRNGWFVHNIEPGDLAGNIEKRMKESSCTDQDKQKLKKILSTLDEEANNVVFIGKLK